MEWIKDYFRCSGKRSIAVIIFCGILVVGVLVSSCCPKTGRYVLLDESAMDAVFISMVALSVLLAIPEKIEGKRVIKSKNLLLGVVFGVSFGWMAVDSGIDIMKDVASGPVTECLTECSISASRGTRSLRGHYNLHGVDSQGQAVELEISRKDYARFKGEFSWVTRENSVAVTYYKNSSRVVGY